MSDRDDAGVYRITHLFLEEKNLKGWSPGKGEIGGTVGPPSPPHKFPVSEAGIAGLLSRGGKRPACGLSFDQLVKLSHGVAGLLMHILAEALRPVVPSVLWIGGGLDD